jgi:hypothetical protein
MILAAGAERDKMEAVFCFEFWARKNSVGPSELSSLNFPFPA